jgi:hypothetical protein
MTTERGSYAPEGTETESRRIERNTMRRIMAVPPTSGEKNALPGSKAGQGIFSQVNDPFRNISPSNG